jgi:hypothetical protein
VPKHQAVLHLRSKCNISSSVERHVLIGCRNSESFDSLASANFPAPRNAPTLVSSLQESAELLDLELDVQPTSLVGQILDEKFEVVKPLRSEPSGEIYIVTNLITGWDFEMKVYSFQNIPSRERYNRLRSLKRLQANPSFRAYVQLPGKKCIIYERKDVAIKDVVETSDSTNAASSKKKKSPHRAEVVRSNQTEKRKLKRASRPLPGCCLHCEITRWLMDRKMSLKSCAYCSGWVYPPSAKGEKELQSCCTMDTPKRLHCDVISVWLCDEHYRGKRR